MSRNLSFALVCIASLISTSLPLRSANAITVGGWTADRGGDSGILAGADFNNLRNELSTYFPGVTLAESGTLTSTFLNSIDVLVISPVYGGGSVTSSPLSAAEQSAMTTWVSGGGRALIVGENFNYYATSQSMIGPFGPQWESTSNFGVVQGVVTDHTSLPAITDGPFGVVNSFSGGYDAFFANVSPATPLGTWNDTGGVGLAAMDFGAGKVVFFGTNSFLYGVGAGHPNNDPLRRNTLTYLLGVAPQSPYDYNHNGSVDTADYIFWRQNDLAADGNQNSGIDSGDYDLWRGEFGMPGFTGSGTGLNSPAVPEPAGLVLVSAIALFITSRRLRYQSLF